MAKLTNVHNSRTICSGPLKPTDCTPPGSPTDPACITQHDSFKAHWRQYCFAQPTGHDLVFFLTFIMKIKSNTPTKIYLDVSVSIRGLWQNKMKLILLPVLATVVMWRGKKSVILVAQRVAAEELVSFSSDEGLWQWPKRQGKSLLVVFDLIFIINVLPT